MLLWAARAGWEVIVARMRGSVAAGVALVAAVVTIGGPGIAAASADPDRGGSHHDRGRSDDRDRGDRGDRPGERRGHGDGRRSESRADGDSSQSGGSDGSGSDGDTAPRGTTGTSSGSASDTNATAEPEPAVGRPTAPAATDGGGGGVPAEADAPTVHEPPAVVVGNGRSPGLLSSGPAGAEDRRTAVSTPRPDVPAAPVLLPQAPPTAIPAVDTESQRPRVFSGMWSPVGAGGSSNTLFGLAGLILIPLAGVWLGHRQALGARAARDLVDR